MGEHNFPADTEIEDKPLDCHWKTKERRKFVPIGNLCLPGRTLPLPFSAAARQPEAKKDKRGRGGWFVWQFNNTCKQELSLVITSLQRQIRAEDEELCHLGLVCIKLEARWVFILQMWPLWQQSLHPSGGFIPTGPVLLLPADHSLSSCQKIQAKITS